MQNGANNKIDLGLIFLSFYSSYALYFATAIYQFAKPSSREFGHADFVLTNKRLITFVTRTLTPSPNSKLNVSQNSLKKTPTKDLEMSRVALFIDHLVFSVPLPAPFKSHYTDYQFPVNFKQIVID